VCYVAAKQHDQNRQKTKHVTGEAVTQTGHDWPFGRNSKWLCDTSSVVKFTSLPIPSGSSFILFSCRFKIVRCYNRMSTLVLLHKHHIYFTQSLIKTTSICHGLPTLILLK